MNHLSKTKLILYLAAIFVAGGVTGATVAVKAAKQIMTEAPRTGPFEARYLKEEARQWQLAVLKRGGAVPIPTNLMEREQAQELS